MTNKGIVMRSSRFAVLGLVCALSVGPAHARPALAVPLAAADPGHPFSIGTERRDAGRSAGGSPELDAVAVARVQSGLKALVPEYRARLTRDGEDSANEWIRQKAFELGQVEAEHMKRRLGMN